MMSKWVDQGYGANVGKNKNIHWLLLILITLLAAVLRLYKLGEWSLWIDEVGTLDHVRMIFDYPVRRRPLSYLLIHLSTSTFGVNEWAARFPPTIVGIVSIPLLYHPIRKIYGSAVALIAALLLALSPWRSEERRGGKEC